MASQHSTGTPVCSGDPFPHPSVVLHAEIGTDADTGRPWLLASTDDHDWREITTAELRSRVEGARRELERVSKLAAQYEAIEELTALAVEHKVTVEEWDTASLDSRLRDDFVVWDRRIGGHRYLIFPKGQAPDERLAAARDLLEPRT